MYLTSLLLPVLLLQERDISIGNIFAFFWSIHGCSRRSCGNELLRLHTCFLPWVNAQSKVSLISDQSIIIPMTVSNNSGDFHFWHTTWIHYCLWNALIKLYRSSKHLSSKFLLVLISVPWKQQTYQFARIGDSRLDNWCIGILASSCCSQDCPSGSQKVIIIFFPPSQLARDSFTALGPQN